MHLSSTSLRCTVFIHLDSIDFYNIPLYFPFGGLFRTHRYQTKGKNKLSSFFCNLDSLQRSVYKDQLEYYLSSHQHNVHYLTCVSMKIFIVFFMQKGISYSPTQAFLDTLVEVYSSRLVCRSWQKTGTYACFLELAATTLWCTEACHTQCENQKQTIHQNTCESLSFFSTFRHLSRLLHQEMRKREGSCFSRLILSHIFE